MMQQRVNMPAAFAVLIVASMVQSCFATAEGVVNQNLTYGVSAFTNASYTVPATTLYVGADDIGAEATDADKAYTLCATTLDTSGAQPAVAVRALAAQAGVVVNSDAAGASPIFNKKVALLGLMNSLPIVRITDDETPANEKNIYWLGRFDGNIVLKNTVDINDFASAATEEIVAVAGTGASESPATIFAAVSATGGSWDEAAGTNRGIALLRQAADNKSLDVYDATDFSLDTNKACQLTAITIDLAATDYALSSGVNMIWSSDLGRLYCGLTGVKGAAGSEAGGVLSVVMGRYEPETNSTSFVLKPIVAGVSSAHFATGLNDQIIGAYVAAAADTLSVTARNLCIMHTSTGKYYLIVRSTIGDGTFKGVYAVPLLTSDDLESDEYGTVSAVDANGVATFAVPANSNDMPKATHIPARVFVGQLVKGAESDAYDTTANLFVVGDTVYLCAKNDGSLHNVASGIFAATALFNEAGAIRGWQYSSPENAQPVMGQVGQVVGGGRDAGLTGDFYALTTENKVLTEGSFGAVNTVRISHWGSTSYMGIGNLSAVLQEIFPADQGGVIGLYSFGRSTVGFTEVPGEYFSMLVAIGLNKVAMIQLIKNDETTNELVINTVFEEGTNVFVFDTTTNPALAAIAPLTYAEWARMPSQRGDHGGQGWLFVGGRNGVAVLSTDAGAGATLPLKMFLDPISADNYPDTTQGWTFKKLNSGAANFSHVRKLVARNGKMYVVTRSNVYSFDIDVDAQYQVNPEDVNAVPVFLPDAWIADMVVFAPDTDSANNRGVIATSSGLYASPLDGVTQALLIQNTPTDRFAIQLQVLADQPCGSATNGNIYALLTDMTNDTAQKPNDKLYRFDVPDAQAVDLTTFAQPVILPNASGLMREFNSYEQNIDDDGSFLYSTMPWNYGTLGNVNLYLQNTAMDRSFNVLPLLDEEGRVTGVMHDEATGIIMVPGQSSGMNVNG